MKKVLSVLLAVAMLAALAVPAFAVARSSVEATRKEVATITYGDWAKVEDGVLKVTEGVAIWLGDMLAGYDAGKTAIRVSPECTYALVANTDKLTVNSEGYLVPAKATAEGEVVEILATFVDNKEITFPVKVKVEAWSNTENAKTVVNATGYVAEGFDWVTMANKEADQPAAALNAKTAKLKAVSYFTADKVLFTEKQKTFLENYAENLKVEGWVNKMVNGQLVKVSLYYAINKFDNYANDVVNNRTALNEQVAVPMSDLLTYLNATLAVDVSDATVAKFNFNFAANTNLTQAGESVTFSLVADNFPVVNTNGTDGVAVVPAVTGSYRVNPWSSTTNSETQSSLAVYLSDNGSVEVGKFITATAVYNKLVALPADAWGVSYALNAASAPDQSVIWDRLDTDKNGEYETAKVMGVRVGSNLVVVEAEAAALSAGDADNTAGASATNKVLTAKALVTVTPRLDAVVEEDAGESDVPQTGAALLANLF